MLDEHPRIAFVHSAFRSIDGNDNVLDPAASWAGRLATDTIEPGREFIRKCMPHPSRGRVPTAMFRRLACPDPPYDPEAAFLPDLILWLTIALDHDVMFLKEPNAAFRAHDEGDSTGFGTGYRVTFTCTARTSCWSCATRSWTG